MTNIERTGFSELDRLLELVQRTRELLDVVVGEGRLPDGGASYLAEQTLPHIEGVQAGFHGWLRSDSAGLAELQFLIRRVAALRVEPPRDEVDRAAAAAEAQAEALAAASGLGHPEPAPATLRAGRDRGPTLPRADPWHLAALAHARLVFAMIPRVPADAVRFPSGRRTYSDIPTPRGPAELALRLEELETQLWRAATGRAAPPIDPAFRRTYGFFDAADRLGARAFGAFA
jgi:hypothetical protein